MRLFTDVASGVDDPFLRHALALAERARGCTAPNPLVGCVIVRDDRIVGEGYHARAGGPHAEVVALADTDADAARGSHAYVTLEPCSHHGLTPPCTEALIAAGISKVTVGMPDPTSLAGNGARTLREAGIEVVFAADPTPFAELNEGWLKRSATGLPFITAKVGTSLDARVSLCEGERSSMTGEWGAQVTRRLRERVDAVIVGASTAACDDPALTVRDGVGCLAPRQPVRVVLAGQRMPAADARVFTDGCATTIVLAPDDPTHIALSPSAEVVRYPAEEGLAGAFRVLGGLGMNDVLVEPGPTLLAALWDGSLMDALVTVTAGGMAGFSGQSLYAKQMHAADDANALERRFAPLEAAIVGDVSVTVWRPRADSTVT